MSNEPKRKYVLQLDPKILKLLGPSLYTNIYYILAELIANAHDADAKNVYIISKSDSITVEDDGTGMSYEDTKVYLNVAVETRTTKKDSLTKGGRRRIGRKGVGKLAALSVSEYVYVQTIKDRQKSGFVLTRHVNADKELEALEEKDMRFDKIKGHGTSIIMKNPHYQLNRSFEVIKKNLLKIFPLIDKGFRIHIIQNNKVDVINSFDREMIGQLGGLITIGKEFKYLVKYFRDDYPNKKKKLLEVRGEERRQLELEDTSGGIKKHNLVIKGWMGAYRSTRGRKAGFDDFPDNFISLLSNGKVGEYNILPIVGRNKLQEVYVVGQLHVDLFEETELPDMALSNRQGYKTDDPRFQEVISFVAKKLLPDIVELRTTYACYDREAKDKERLERQGEKEKGLRESVDRFKEKASCSASKKIGMEIVRDNACSASKMGEIIRDEMNALFPIIGLKQRVDAQKKKILLCHTKTDKDLCDIIYEMLLFNRAPAEDIIYTNCDDEICRIPVGVSVHDYLRKFFVDSYSTEKIYVIYVTSDAMAQSWGAVTEVGAGWVTQVAHKVFNIEGHKPAKPLNIEAEWQSSARVSGGIAMSGVECDKFASRIESVCDKLGYRKRSRKENVDRMKSFITMI